MKERTSPVIGRLNEILAEGNQDEMYVLTYRLASAIEPCTHVDLLAVGRARTIHPSKYARAWQELQGQNCYLTATERASLTVGSTAAKIEMGDIRLAQLYAQEVRQAATGHPNPHVRRIAAWADERMSQYDSRKASPRPA